MTEQTEHILNISQNLLDRLSWIKFKPNNVLCEGLDKACSEKFKNKSEGKPDLILSICKISEEKVSFWKNNLKPGGLLLFGLLNLEFDVREVGDALTHYGFIDVVIDSEDNVVYGHALLPKPISVSIDQIRRG